MRTTIALASFGSLLSLTAACGGGQPSATTPAGGAPSASAAPVASDAPTASTPDATPAPSASASASASAAPIPTVWSADMPKEQQMAFMKQNVVGRMGKVFQDADPAHNGDFGCKTCHGPDYKNPHDYLPHLTFKNGNLTAFAEKPEAAKFMAQKVAPEMASAMGLPPFDMKTHQGFGCGGCHTIDMK